MSSSQIVVLGCGLVGSAIVRDLSLEPRFSVTAIDVNETNLSRIAHLDRVSTLVGDVTVEGAVETFVSDADLVVCAVPGFMGYATLERIIKAGKPVVDISFFPEDAFGLDELATEMNVTAVVDCGVAPGLCNIQAGWVQARLNHVESYICYVGGLPTVRNQPFEYRAVFSPIDVIEEYTRPARYVEHGELVTREALTGIEPLDFEGVGTLEAFNTDGLRSLIHTLDAPFKKEMTLRYPGHAALMRTFRDTGLFSENAISVRGGTVRPIDVTSRLLFDAWKMTPEDRDLTVMRVEMSGTQGDEKVTWRFDLLDHFDEGSGVHSMARTTGYTCTLVTRLVLDGAYTRIGISPPEYVGEVKGCYETLLEGYEERGISVKASRTVSSR